jgi:uncharacterized protein
MPATLCIRTLSFALLNFGLLAGIAEAAPQCDARWHAAVQAQLAPADGHGPDPGSPEWQAAVEHQLGLRGAPKLPARGSPAWCQRVQGQLDAACRAPTCRKAAEAGSMEQLVCQHAGLRLLDVQLATLYGAATKQAANEHPPLLAAEQHGWQRGRNECWKAGPDPSKPGDQAARAACVRESYERRILELQVRYRLVPASGPLAWRCNDGSEVVVRHFPSTQPPSLMAERGDQTSLMTQQATASGTRYVGRNESFWEHQGEARVVWGWQAPEIVCKPAP